MLLSEVFDYSPKGVEAEDEDYELDFEGGTVKIAVFGTQVSEDVELSIVYRVEYGDVDFERHEATEVPYGSTYVTYEAAGYEMTDIEVLLEIDSLLVDGNTVTENEFKRAGKLSDEVYQTALKLAEKEAEKMAKYWAMDNAEYYIEAKEKEDRSHRVRSWFM